MKIKLDFVTNSSSTAYVLFIPIEYELDKDRIKNTSEYKEYIEDKPTPKEIDKLLYELNNDITILKTGEAIMIGPYGYESLILYKIFEEDNLIFKIIGVDGEGANTFSPVSLKELKKFISKIEEL